MNETQYSDTRRRQETKLCQRVCPCDEPIGISEFRESSKYVNQLATPIVSSYNTVLFEVESIRARYLSEMKDIIAVRLRTTDVAVIRYKHEPVYEQLYVVFRPIKWICFIIIVILLDAIKWIVCYSVKYLETFTCL